MMPLVTTDYFSFSKLAWISATDPGGATNRKAGAGGMGGMGGSVGSEGRDINAALMGTAATVAAEGNGGSVGVVGKVGIKLEVFNPPSGETKLGGNVGSVGTVGKVGTTVDVFIDTGPVVITCGSVGEGTGTLQSELLFRPDCAKVVEKPPNAKRMPAVNSSFFIIFLSSLDVHVY